MNLCSKGAWAARSPGVPARSKIVEGGDSARGSCLRRGGPVTASAPPGGPGTLGGLGAGVQFLATLSLPLRGYGPRRRLGYVHHSRSCMGRVTGGGRLFPGSSASRSACLRVRARSFTDLSNPPKMFRSYISRISPTLQKISKNEFGKIHRCLCVRLFREISVSRFAANLGWVALLLWW